MELIRGIHNLKKKFFHSIVTIGNFDGIHLGHQKIFSSACEIRKKNNIPIILILFEPQPLEFLKIKPLPKRLTILREKIKYLSLWKINYILCIKFNSFFASLSPEDFIINILINKLCMRFIIIGDDFRFGSKRHGNISLLENIGKKNNFQVIKIASMNYLNIKISSTNIRNALSNDNIVLANKLLGRSFSLSGTVIHGNAIGRLLGYPTANISLNNNCALNNGVYAITAHVPKNKNLIGIANIGVKLYQEKKKRILEVHLFNINLNLYEKKIEIIFHKKIRNEKIFSSLEKLKNQISRDIIKVKIYFKKYSNFIKK
ncbi:bifunctional riboflavin kinase/FAD synthetase [Buchnera aphidicola]|uniref:bifunctional riboflavin kinase/FAD synthetase n=1 Tax=Buchnera aphidicola TaxID=9 RepID=UPI003BEEFE8B